MTVAKPGPQLTPPSSPGLLAWLQSLLFGTILNKIVLPFLILTLIVAAGGTVIVALLASSSVQERFGAALVDATRAASDALAAWEGRHLNDLQILVFSGGVPEAIAQGDSRALTERLALVAASQEMARVIAFDEQHRVLADIEMAGAGYEVGSLLGLRVEGLSPVDEVLGGLVDARGDKHSGIVSIDGEAYLVTVAPVFAQDRALAGAVAIATPLRSIFNQIKLEILADVSAFDPDGRLIETTLSALEQPGVTLPDPQLLRSVYLSGGRVQITDLSTAESAELYESTSLSIGDRGEFRTVLAPLYLRGQSIGVLAVSQPPTVVNNVLRTNRIGLTLVFTLLAVLVVITGYAIAQNLSRPIRKLTESARAVYGGDLSRESGVRTNDEIGVLGVTFDEMTRRLQQQTLSLEVSNLAQQREAAFLSSILSSAGDGIVVIGLDREVLRSNPVAQALIEHDLDRWLTVLADLVAQVKAEGIGRLRIESQGKHYEALANPVRIDSAEEPVGIIVAIRNVTDQVLTDRMRNSFIAQISHELRTPLTVIKGFTDLATHMLEPQQDTLRGFLKSVQENTDSLNTMLNRILDVTLMVRGSLEIERDLARLRDLIDDVIRPHQELINNKGLRLSIDCPADLRLFVDVGKFKWAFNELIKNSLQYTESGDEIRIVAGLEGDELLIRVSDSGVGIAPAELPRVFEQFYRGFPTREDGSLIETRGAGLGLFVLRSVIDAHGGAVSVESDIYKGTSFLLRLPTATAGSDVKA